MSLKNYKTVSLVLGSGGARGYAHIGAIEEIEKRGYKITSISGASMGSLIGGLYAAGKLNDYKDWVLGLNLMDVAKLLDVSFSKRGLIRGDKVFKIIEELLGDTIIESLPIHYTAVATNLLKQKEAWFQHGSLIDAIRASISIPTIFTPKKIGDDYFIDGGVLDPLPIAPLIADNSDLTIAVDLNAPAQIQKPKTNTPQKEIKKANRIKDIFLKTERELASWFEHEEQNSSTDENINLLNIVGQSIDIMQNAIRECRTAGNKADITVEVPNNICGFYEFNRAYEMIEIGRELTKNAFEDWENR